MPFKFHEKECGSSLQISVLLSARNDNEIVQYWQTRYDEPQINYSDFHRLSVKFKLSDFKKARLAIGLRNIAALVDMHRLARTTPTVEAQLKTLKELVKSIDILAKRGALLKSKKEGAAIRILAVNMASAKLQSYEIENWLKSAIIAKRVVSLQIRQIHKRTRSEFRSGLIDKRKLSTWERVLAVKYLPSLYEKISGSKYSIEQGEGGEVKDTPAVLFVLFAARCINYNLTDMALIKAHIRAKPNFKLEKTGL